MAENNELSLRVAMDNDLPFLMGLRKVTMTTHFADMGLALSDQQHQQRIKEAFDASWIIQRQDEAIGMVKYRVEQHHIHLMQLQVSPAHQRQGVGEWVVRRILSLALTFGCPVELSVLKANPAQRLYRRLGFVETHTDDHEYYLRHPGGKGAH